ncbi:E3 ubiquitin-protein ligase TRIM39 [Denticeps clupeoides]|uniref:E3 ubiquitin-protein ligase TRIM39-like n=1 Tax=Denticeps clupeoides TaxID=299321 RepID=A0AAY4EQG9_9TELE|nr:E3 ubiquitin-protein ligase TRIM39-like [Denticeps clupeoides]XP_028831023.1 E3 ubiquitin-protein ligase TRIM39-like [Denticeps clupeoides]XP_028831024.1 E3 ubiquitin-protein ligase TRIM39-like [Denticeps clupeoides]
MASSGDFLSEEQFSCSICLEMFSNPVSTPCGHSFCLNCINSYWDGKNKDCQCPLCKESFRRRPELHVNHTLKEITENFKRLSTKTTAVDGLTSSPKMDQHTKMRQYKDMPNELFAEMKNRFQKTSDPSCEPGSPATTQNLTRRFTVTGYGSEAARGSDVLPCPQHRLPLEMFCRTDQICVCTMCSEGAHYGHTIVPAKREWNIKKAHMGIVEVEIKDLITQREKKVEEIKTSLANIQASADKESQGTISVFAELMASIERSQAELLEVVEMGRRAAELRAQAIVRDLEQEIAELKERIATLSELSQSNDHIMFLKTFPTACVLPPQTRDWTQVTLTPDPTAGAVLRTVTQAAEQIQQELAKLPNICLRSDAGPLTQQSKIWKVQEYTVDVTFDPATAHPRLILSADGKRVHCSDRYLSLPDVPERFDRVVCVLGQQAFSSGRQYWEVYVGIKTDWDLGVASHAINRKGKITVSPAHGYWFLSLRDKNDYAFRTEPPTPLRLTCHPQRIGIFLDMDKGQLSFYDAESRQLLHTYMDAFPENTRPFFSPCTNKSGRNEAPLVICKILLD